MRPVNLLPPEERAGSGSASRTGIAPYLIVGVLVVALGFAVFLVTTNNTITEREDELAALEVREESAAQRAAALAPYVEFASLGEARQATVSSLASTRFDWARVMNELALVTPDDVWLLGLTGSAGGAATEAGGGGGGDQAGTSSALTATITGPSLVIEGCATGQGAVADYVSDLELIDGVTRVGLEDSTRPSPSEAAEDSEEECGSFPKFIAALAFDEAPVPPSADAATAPVPAPTEEGAEAAPPEGSTDTGSTEAAPASASTEGGQ